MPLNEQQMEAVNTIDGQLLVIACPGSGKTTTMVHRIHNIIQTKKISPKSVIMMTFSKASAEDMKKRYEAEYDERGVIFCTLHSFCFSTLKACHVVTADSILTDTEKYTIFSNILKEVHYRTDKKEFLTDLMTDIGNVKKSMADIDNYSPQCCDDKNLFKRICFLYDQALKEARKIDFDDMLLLTLKLFQERPEYVERLRKAYPYIQIDEYQDTSRIQMEILYLLAGPNGNIACVGDDDQCIYSFAGASPGVMRDFTKHYPDTKLIHLDTNYRSGGKIISAAKDVIEHNPARYKKQFLAGRGEEGTLEIVTDFSNKRQQYEAVAKQIRQILHGKTTPEQVAVLYRTKQQGEFFSQYLKNENIMFQSLDKLPSKYENFIFQDIMSYHAMAEQTEEFSRYDLFLLVNKPNRYISMDFLKNGLDKKYMMRVAAQTDEPWKQQRQFQQINDLFVLLDCLKGKTPKEFLDRFDKMGYDRYMRDQAKFRNLDESDFEIIYQSYVEDLSRHNIETWEDWIQYANAYNESIRQMNKERTGVVLSTMHKAKGLEWENVIIIDCVDKICPLKKAVTDLEQEEERRLFYVAMTRAKDHLWLYGYQKKVKHEGGTRKNSLKDNGVSRFVTDIRLDKKVLDCHAITMDITQWGRIKWERDQQRKREMAQAADARKKRSIDSLKK